jgi:predicted transcriptional regulator
MSLALLHYHLTRLEFADLIVRHKLGRQVRYFPAGVAVDPADDDLALLQTPAARRIAGILVEHPGIGLAALVETSGLTPRVVYHHLKRFKDAGLLVTASRKYAGLEASWRLQLLVAILFDE